MPRTRTIMPLQNRVTPFGELVCDPARGLFMGNRGGRFHRDGRTLGQRRYAGRAWICCHLDFKGRRRDVWGRGYTELFFLDEPTAFAAGHRPCFECRRAEAEAFRAAWARGHGLASPPRADDIDRVLHAERRNGRTKRVYGLTLDDLPDGAFVVLDGQTAAAVLNHELLVWRPDGYGDRLARPQGGVVNVLTPPSILATLQGGYRPQWHDSVGGNRPPFGRTS